MFQELAQESFAEREERVLAFWKKGRIFERSVEERKDHPTFLFYDGPPFATGLPHYGHLLAGTIKDVVPRYKTMKGFQVPRRFGWDCHGLPIENIVETSQKLSGAASIEAFGIDRFNEECRKVVLRYTEEWKDTVTRMGRWVDFSKTYHTMDRSFMESVWWVFKQLFDNGHVYEGFKVMPFSAQLGTPLSNFEATQNYKDVDDPALTVGFPLVDEPNTMLLAWTTTPWTLVSNLAITAGPEIDYVKVKDTSTGICYILGKDRLSTFYHGSADYEILDTFKGTALKGKKYVPLFDYFKDHPGAFQVVVDDFVTTEEGTGLVHTAPAFGEQDFYAAKKAGIDIVCPVDRNGHFTAEIPEYAGLFVKDADKAIARRIKDAGRLIHQATIRHRYPFCWRSDTPLIYRAMSSWFVGVEAIKDRLLAANEQIHWTPEHIREGRFGKWLAGARDWAISRNRYWGTPIPLWRSEEGDIIAIGSIAELEELTGAKITDLHRHFIDDLTFTKNGKVYRRISEVFDCWFESGSMPYAQNHYPFEGKEAFDKAFPADFIAEGLDQTRGWFYTLTVLSVALFNKPAFKNVIVNGIILAEDGNKMSKRLQNYPDPMAVTRHYGADAIRLYMLHSPAVKGDDLCFSERGVELVLRQILIPWWNAYGFFITYARVYNWKPGKERVRPTAEIDCWILSLAHGLVEGVEEGMEAYDLSKAVEPLVSFVDSLTNWYIRRSRRRFWEEMDSPDRQQAFATLYEVLMIFAKVAAPFVPFVTDAMYANLRGENDPESVHLCDYPRYDAAVRDTDLELAMDLIMKASSMGHALRKDNKLKVRQPLAAVYIASHNKQVLGFLEAHKHLIADELNVKNVFLIEDERQFVQWQAKPNFRVLGKKVGKLMPQVQLAVQQLDPSQLQALTEGGTATLSVAGEEFTLTTEDVAVERIVKEGIIASNSGSLTVALDVQLTDDLLMEGLSREIVNKINTMRRESGLDVQDRIAVTLQTTDRVRACYDIYGAYISGEVLSTSTHFAPCTGTPWDLNGELTTILITKN